MEARLDTARIKEGAQRIAVFGPDDIEMIDMVAMDDGGQAPVPLGWNPAARQWLSWDGTALAPDEAARRFRYLGPALPPAEGVVEAAAAEKFTPVSAHPADMVPRRDAIRNHLLIFAGSVVATLFLAEKIVR